MVHCTVPVEVAGVLAVLNFYYAWRILVVSPSFSNNTRLIKNYSC